jgi:hypothetical protein
MTKTEIGYRISLRNHVRSAYRLALALSLCGDEPTDAELRSAISRANARQEDGVFEALEEAVWQYAADTKEDQP